MNLKSTTYKRLKELCSQKYEFEWLPRLARFEQCGRHREEEEEQSRIKRFVVWVLLLLAIAVIAVTAAVVTTAIKLNNKIDAVNQTLEETRIEVDTLKMAAKKNSELNNDVAQQLQSIIEATESLRKEVVDMATYNAEAIWSGTDLFYGIHLSSGALDKLAESCENGEVDTEALLYLLDPKREVRTGPINEIRSMRTSRTRLESVRRVDSHTIDITFLGEHVSKDNKVYTVEAFDVWVNLTDTPKLTRYIGPKHIIHNKRLNCTKGIQLSDSAQQGIYDSCETADYTDPRLQEWQDITNDDSNHKTEPQIKRTKTDSFVYCLYGNITLGNDTLECPPYVMHLNKVQSFVTRTYNHTARTIFLNATSFEPVIVQKHMNESMDSEVYQDQIRLLKKIKEKNIEVARILGDMEKTNLDNNIRTGGIVASIIVIAIMLWVLTVTRGKPKHSNTITVVTTPLSQPKIYERTPEVPVYYSRVERPAPVYEEVQNKTYYPRISLPKIPVEL